ncbi:ATP-grasp domain-containing protein [Nocardia terpenica]|uniref:ATP-grasp domain-containing protein n=1 Tax=Nocardia terpenica TaxID=455432 RepID=UPI0002DCDC2E|nr:ATP-grasp domain-containing protein [Nocardia terpenica]
MTAAILYPCDPLRPRRVDPHFAAEADSARELGSTVALVDHDALLAGDAEAAVRMVPDGLGAAWYRGWMIPSERYVDFEAAAAARRCRLSTSAASYRLAHELPGWYSHFAALTPASAWLAAEPGVVPGISELAASAAALGGGPGIVKDYVKSRKHDWEEACFVPDLADIAALHRIVSRFVELQQEWLAGGIVLRNFESFEPIGEARIWWVDGRPVLIGPHPDTPDKHVRPDLSGLPERVRALGPGSRFVTTDIALRVDGVWRVVEVGDGQVSDLPAGADPRPLLEALIAARSADAVAAEFEDGGNRVSAATGDGENSEEGGCAEKECDGGDQREPDADGVVQDIAARGAFGEIYQADDETGTGRPEYGLQAGRGQRGRESGDGQEQGGEAHGPGQAEESSAEDIRSPGAALGAQGGDGGAHGADGEPDAEQGHR